MRVLFVYPESESLGVEYLSAVLKKAGHDVGLAFDPRLFATYYMQSIFFEKIFDFKKHILSKIL